MTKRILEELTEDMIKNISEKAYSISEALSMAGCKYHSSNIRIIKKIIHKYNPNSKCLKSISYCKNAVSQKSMIWVSLSDDEFKKLIMKSTSYSAVMQGLGFRVRGGKPFDQIKERINLLKINTEHFKLKGVPSNKINLDDIIVHNKHPHYSTGHLRRRLIKEGLKENKCEVCNITEWMGKPVVMQLDHIDGNNKNHLLENLRTICPTCHSQTETFCGKNTKKMKENKKLRGSGRD